jgi:hypothetical protein
MKGRIGLSRDAIAYVRSGRKRDGKESGPPRILGAARNLL